MSKAKKIIFVIFVVTLLCCSSFIVSAEDSAAYPVFKFLYSQPQIGSNSCYLEVMKTDGSCFLVYATGFVSASKKEETVTGYFQAKLEGQYLIVEYLPQRYDNGDYENFGDGAIYGFVVQPNGNTITMSNDLSYKTAIWLGTGISGVHGYNCDVSSMPNTSHFTVIYGSDNYLSGQIAALESLFRSFYSYIDSNHEEEIASAKENADNIIGSLGGNADYQSPSSGDIGSLGDVEGQLISGNKVQSDEAINRIQDNVFGSVQRLASSFGAVSSLFQDMLFTKLPDFSVLIYFSLIFGLLPVILGLTINQMRKHDIKVQREKRNK